VDITDIIWGALSDSETKVAQSELILAVFVISGARKGLVPLWRGSILALISVRLRWIGSIVTLPSGSTGKASDVLSSNSDMLWTTLERWRRGTAHPAQIQRGWSWSCGPKGGHRPGAFRIGAGIVGAFAFGVAPVLTLLGGMVWFAWRGLRGLYFWQHAAAVRRSKRAGVKAHLTAAARRPRPWLPLRKGGQNGGKGQAGTEWWQTAALTERRKGMVGCDVDGKG